VRDIVLCAWRELSRRKGRTVTNIAGYVLAVCALVLLTTVVQFARAASNAVLNSTGTRFMFYLPSCEVPCYLKHGETSTAKVNTDEAYIAGGGTFTVNMTVQNLDFIRTLPHVERVAPYILFRFKDANAGTLYTVGGVDLSTKEYRDLVGATACAENDVSAGRYLTPADAGMVLVTKAFAMQRHLELGDPLRIAGQRYPVVGIVDPGVRLATADVYMPIADVRKAINRRVPFAADGNQYNILIVESRTAKEAPAAMAAIKTKFAEGIVAASSCAKAAAHVLGLSDSSALLLVVLLGLFTLVFTGKSQLASVVERRRDIGILKAIGWTDGEVTRLILAESLTQAAIGGAIGSVLAVCILLFVPIKLISGLVTNMPLTLNPLYPIAGVLLALLGGGVAGGIPALVAARQRPTDALRQL
jgi:putative ABC transport system permease protein